MLVSGCSKSDVTARPGGEGGEQTVEIVPAEGSVNLDEFSGQIVSVEENAIYFQFSGTEKGTASKAQTKVLLPALLVPGAIAYALTPSERFPHGYLGRVVEVIEEEGGLVKALMERTTISESFDLFRVSGSFEMEAETDGGSSGFKIHGEDGYMYLTGHIDTKLGDAGKAEYSFLPSSELCLALDEADNDCEDDEEDGDTACSSVYNGILNKRFRAIDYCICIECACNHISESCDYNEAEEPAESEKELASCLSDILLNEKTH